MSGARATRRVCARAAVIGCGGISKEHLHVLGAHPRIELVGVCDRSPAAARWTAERYGSAAYTDHRELLDAARPDVVHVLTPPSSHRPIAEDAIRAGAHVIVEKPIASCAEDLRDMLRLAGEHDRMLIENHNYRFNDGMVAIDDLLARGVLGDVVACDVLLALDLATSKFAGATNPTAHLAGGAVRDFITHLTYLAMHPFGDAAVGDVDARWWNRSGNEHIGADELEARVDCGSGVASLRFSSRIAPDCFRVWVRGTAGTVETDLYQPFLRVETARGPKQLSPVVNHGINGASLALSSVRNLRDKVLQRSPYHGLWTLLERFYAAVLDGAPPPVTAAQVLRANEVIDRIVVSAGAR
jgi:predicted dehydrogenase